MNIEEIKSDLLTERMEQQIVQYEHIPSTILVVDDDTSIRKGLVYLLRAEGYKTMEAKDGREALSLISVEYPDLILLDLMMPDINGLMVCRQLKSIEETRLIPIVMITAVYELEEKLKAIDAGVDDFLNKPINIPELRARVKSLLRMKHMNDLLDSADTVISSLANAIEAKDKYTEGHNERVSYYAVALARAVGLSERGLEIVRMAGILHDIGKIGVPDKVLNKRSSLNKLEFNSILSHPEKGQRILNPLHSLMGVREVVLYHHERYDGKGYPHGLEGEQIPFYARIMSIADAYDAMTSTRPYRKAFTKSEAIRKLEDKAGQMWDPELVKIFINLVKNNDENDSMQTDNVGEKH